MEKKKSILYQNSVNRPNYVDRQFHVRLGFDLFVKLTQISLTHRLSLIGSDW